MIVKDERHHLPAFILLHLASDLKTSHLLIERVEKLLACRSSCERRAVMLRSSEATEIEQAFFRAREGNAHAVEKVNDRGSHLAHGFRRWLIRQKVSAIDRVVKVFPRRIAFAFRVDRAVDA